MVKFKVSLIKNTECIEGVIALEAVNQPQFAHLLKYILGIMKPTANNSCEGIAKIMFKN